MVAICCTRFGLDCDTRYMVSISDVHFHVMLKDVMVATTTTMKTYTETQKRDESAGDRGMEALVFLTFHLGFFTFLTYLLKVVKVNTVFQHSCEVFC